jgi:enoyl-CoA hydratase
LPHDGVEAIAEFAETLPAFSLEPHRAAIDRCFAPDSVAGIVGRLRAERSAWADEILATLGGHSPTALAVALAAMRRGAGLDLPAALAAELRLTRQVTRHPDFAEGVRAMVVDKDRKPRWSPPTIEQIDAAGIAAMVG